MTAVVAGASTRPELGGAGLDLAGRGLAGDGGDAGTGEAALAALAAVVAVAGEVDLAPVVDAAVAVLVARGAVSDPMTEALVDRKFDAMAGGYGGASFASELRSLLDNIEELPDIRLVTTLLANQQS